MESSKRVSPSLQKDYHRAPSFWGRVYLAWSSFAFVAVFLILYPLFLIFINIKPLKSWTVGLNQIWSWLFFPLSFNPVWVTRNQKAKKLAKQGPVVYVANHGSYLDIAVLTWVLPQFLCFIGKSSLSKVPLFGYIFDHLHISVNRKDGKDRHASMLRAMEQVDNGRPVVFFAEGTIHQEWQPQLSPFKDGAFKVAIEKQIPIIPITLPYNWIVLPGDNVFSARWHRLELVIHDPIDTKGLTLEKDLERIKEQVFATLDATINEKNSPERIKKYGGQQRTY